MRDFRNATRWARSRTVSAVPSSRATKSTSVDFQALRQGFSPTGPGCGADWSPPSVHGSPSGWMTERKSYVRIIC